MKVFLKALPPAQFIAEIEHHIIFRPGFTFLKIDKPVHLWI